MGVNHKDLTYNKANIDMMSGNMDFMDFWQQY